MKSFLSEELVGASEEGDWVAAVPHPAAAPAAGEQPAAEEEAAGERSRRGRTRGGKGPAPEQCRSWQREGSRGQPEPVSPPPGTTTAGRAGRRRRWAWWRCACPYGPCCAKLSKC